MCARNLAAPASYETLSAMSWMYVPCPPSMIASRVAPTLGDEQPTVFARTLATHWRRVDEVGDRGVLRFETGSVGRSVHA
jgi:hypothetical protein